MGLSRRLGFFGVLALSITSLLGTGTFLGVTVGASIAGISSLYSWGILIVLSLCMGLIFAELSSMFPAAGGIYEFTKQTYGKTMSFLSGWTAWIVKNITIVALIIVALRYLFPIHTDLFVIVFAIGLIIAINTIAAIGIQESAFIVLLLTAFLFIVILAIFIPAIPYVNPANLQGASFAAPVSIFIAVFLLVETFFGWETAAYLSEETRNPTRTIPLAILVGTFLVALLVIATVLITIGVFGWEAVSTMNAPFSELAAYVFGDSAFLIVSLSIAILLLASAVSEIVTGPRLMYAMAKDRLFLDRFARINERTKTPVQAIVFQTIFLIIVLLLAYGNYLFVLEMLAPIAMFLYLAMVLAIPILRITRPDVDRGFKMPFGSLISVIIALFFIFLIVNWIIGEEGSLAKFFFSLSLMGVGLPVYFLLRLYYDPEFITKVNERLYPFILSKRADPKIRDELLLFLGTVRGQSLLEIGSATGRFTDDLLEVVGPAGTIYATSFSYAELSFLKKKLAKTYVRRKDLGNIRLIHDTRHFTRIPPEVGDISAVISFGFLSYVQDFDAFAKTISEKLETHGKIFFADYINHYHIFPDPELLSDLSRLKELFKQLGFNVRVKRIRGLLRNQLIIYGIKGSEESPYI